MGITEIATILLIGIAGGLFSGMFGIGGGVVLVPLMILFLHYGQKEAQGTTLALLAFPVALMGAWTYYRKGYVHWDVAAIMAVGFVLGIIASSQVATRIPEVFSLGKVHITDPLRKLFALLMLVLAILMLLGKK